MLITATSALGGIGASPWDRLSRLVFLQLFQSVEEFLARQDRNRNLPLNELKKNTGLENMRASFSLFHHVLSSCAAHPGLPHHCVDRCLAGTRNWLQTSSECYNQVLGVSTNP
ncbi:hypothetical protein QQF64_003857 [Cirrhinus molitorella]|uniref:Uncharacterized protein n=1 Tax=Cirrhinus molitorella TaxID=172907 RepID=A0ABR3MMJ1_9TELE